MGINLFSNSFKSMGAWVFIAVFEGPCYTIYYPEECYNRVVIHVTTIVNGHTLHVKWSCKYLTWGFCISLKMTIVSNSTKSVRSRVVWNLNLKKQLMYEITCNLITQKVCCIMIDLSPAGFFLLRRKEKYIHRHILQLIYWIMYHTHIIKF